jgi:excisionase family DNA binding protein
MTQHSESPQPLLIGKKEAAHLLGVSKRTIENLLRDGALPLRRVRCRTLIPYQAVVDFASGTEQTSEEATGIRA